MAVYDLGLTAEQFYRLTPRMFSMLAKRHAVETKRTEFLHAQTAWAAITFAMGAPKKPVSIKDLMPSEWANKQPQRQARRTEQQIAAEVSAFFKAKISRR